MKSTIGCEIEKTYLLKTKSWCEIKKTLKRINFYKRKNKEYFNKFKSSKNMV